MISLFLMLASVSFIFFCYLSFEILFLPAAMSAALPGFLYRLFKVGGLTADFVYIFMDLFKSFFGNYYSFCDLSFMAASFIDGWSWLSLCLCVVVPGESNLKEALTLFPRLVVWAPGAYWLLWLKKVSLFGLSQF